MFGTFKPTVFEMSQCVRSSIWNPCIDKVISIWCCTDSYRIQYHQMNTIKFRHLMPLLFSLFWSWNLNPSRPATITLSTIWLNKPCSTTPTTWSNSCPKAIGFSMTSKARSMIKFCISVTKRWPSFFTETWFVASLLKTTKDLFCAILNQLLLAI